MLETIRYPLTMTWQRQWESVTRQLERLRSMYAAGSDADELDMTVLVHSYAVAGWGLRDTLLRQHTIVRESVDFYLLCDDPSMKILKGLAVTYKRTSRDHVGTTVAWVAAYHADDRRLDINYYPYERPDQLAVIDAFELAERTHAAWTRFFNAFGLTATG